MIRIDRAHIDDLRSASSAAELHRFVQDAIALEHSTIPPYLTALLSLKPSTHKEITSLLRGIVMDEMLHMCIMGNLMVALGGTVQLAPPSYPDSLPLSIGGDDLVVGIEAFSLDVVQRTFMKIEEPEEPIPVRVLAAAPEYGTIGQFYEALAEKLTELGDEAFMSAEFCLRHQVLKGFDSVRLFPIIDVASARLAIDIIVTEGEGTSTSPFIEGQRPAHYYIFGEIFHGRRLVQTDTGFEYGGAPIPFDAKNVFPMKPNLKLADVDPGGHAAGRMRAFNEAYGALLRALERAFNGQPSAIDGAIALMYDLRVLSAALMQTPLEDGSGLNAGPSYEL